MSAAKKFGLAYRSAFRVKNLMKKFESKGDWPKTKRAASLLDRINNRKNKIIEMEKNK
jgi:hypothetical protein